MRIDGNSAWHSPVGNGNVGRLQSGQPASQPSPGRGDVAMARSTALSALTNERFRAALEMLSDPGSSDTVMQMRGDGGASADDRSVFSSYADNS